MFHYPFIISSLSVFYIIPVFSCLHYLLTTCLSSLSINYVLIISSLSPHCHCIVCCLCIICSLRLHCLFIYSLSLRDLFSSLSVNYGFIVCLLIYSLSLYSIFICFLSVYYIMLILFIISSLYFHYLFLRHLLPLHYLYLHHYFTLS
jgi:hypothetical protein